MICCSASGVGRVVGIEKDLNNNEYVLVEIERPFYDVPNKQRFDIIPLFDWKDNCKRFSKFIDKGDIIVRDTDENVSERKFENEEEFNAILGIENSLD